MRRTLTLVASGLLLAAPLSSQQSTIPAAEQMRQRIEAMLSLPQRATEIRRNGVPDSTVRSVLDILVQQKVPAAEAVTILEHERDASAEHGPTDNFGAFVQSQLAAGKRGRELADAIHAEHRARGKGKPAHAGGRPDEAGRARPDGAGRGGKSDDGVRQKPANDTTRGKRPGNPNAKHPN